MRINHHRLAIPIHIKDHLGNVRVSFDQSGTLIQKDHYYPFGQRMGGLSYDNATSNKYLYGGKELQTEAFGLAALVWYDFGARNYDPQIGRWTGVDVMAEARDNFSPFAYCQNNPILLTDFNGMLDDGDKNYLPHLQCRCCLR